MYLGRLVEVAAAPRLFSAPRHPYTRMLLEAIPTFTADGVSALPPAPKRTGTATPPDPGCPFEPRCPLAFDRCREETPVLAPVGGAGDRAACHLVES
jgi:peptide/nickel transport system ATP-binding protein